MLGRNYVSATGVLRECYEGGFSVGVGGRATGDITYVLRGSCERVTGDITRVLRGY